MLNLLNSNHEEECINKYILSLKKDWEAVINAASIGLSNGATEGNVNKIKQTKRDMYGRTSYELLRKKGHILIFIFMILITNYEEEPVWSLCLYGLGT